MSSLWKKAMSQTVIEDAAREVMLKQNLTAEFGRSVRDLQQSHISVKNVIGGDEVDQMCICLEAIFIHGIKNSFAKKMSSVFSTSQIKMPQLDFWPIVMVYSHRQVLAQLSRLSQISTDVGRCRSWLRLALNDGLIKSYMESLVQDKSTLSSFYNPHAYLRDPEQPDIMRKYLGGLEAFTFSLSYNCYSLNSWTPRVLHLAGLWQDSDSPEPVMPAVDALSSLGDAKIPVPKTREKQNQNCTNEQPQIRVREASTTTDDRGNSGDEKSVSFSEEIFTLEKSTSNEDLAKEGERFAAPASAPSDFHNHTFISMDSGAHMSSPHSVPNIEHMYINNDSLDARGNKLMVQSGWSSSFESDDNSDLVKLNDDNADSHSYDSLLHSYTKNLPETQVLAGTPDLIDYMTLYMGKDESDAPIKELSPSPHTSPDTSEYEIIPKGCSFTSKDIDEATQKLISTFYQIAPEQGLNSQNYKCNKCERPIGMIYGKSKVCSYDGFNYCYECHVSDEHYVPARILHNWDFRKHSVSVHCKKFLLEIEAEPLIDIRIQNPQLYAVVDELVEMQSLRRQLSFLRSYLFTCREVVGENLRKLLWPREYLFEHIHLYSLLDLLQVQNGMLAQLLKKSITFAKKHINGCHLCSQKGFLCEVCNSQQIIYPFETDITYNCEDCFAVYHNTCMNSTKQCPKCERTKKRKEMELWSGQESD